MSGDVDETTTLDLRSMPTIYPTGPPSCASGQETDIPAPWGLASLNTSPRGTSSFTDVSWLLLSRCQTDAFIDGPGHTSQHAAI